jgi:hypothetical protein
MSMLPDPDPDHRTGDAATARLLACCDVLVPCLLYCFKFQRVVHDATVECFSFSFSLTGIVQDGCV